MPVTHPAGTVFHNEVMNMGRLRIEGKVSLPLDIAERKTKMHREWMPSHFTPEDTQRWADAMLEARREELRGVKPTVPEAPRAQLRGLFAWLAVRLDLALIEVSTKTGKVMQPDHYDNTLGNIKSLVAFWLDLDRGWTPKQTPKPALSYFPRQLSQRPDSRGQLDVLLALAEKIDPDPDAFTAEHVKGFIQWLYANEFTGASINTTLSRLAARFKDLRAHRVGDDRRRVVQTNVFRADEEEDNRVFAPKFGKRILTTKEEDALFGALHGGPLHLLPGWTLKTPSGAPRQIKPKTQLQTALMAEILLRTGQRSITIRKDLKLEQYDEESRVLILMNYEETKTKKATKKRNSELGRKGGRVVCIPVDDDLHRCLMAFKALGKWSLDEKTYCRTLRKTLDALGIDIVQPQHGFRHTVITRIAHAFDEVQAAKISGHAVVGVISNYYHYVEGYAQELAPLVAAIKPHPLPAGAFGICTDLHQAA